MRRRPTPVIVDDAFVLGVGDAVDIGSLADRFNNRAQHSTDGSILLLWWAR